LIVKTANATSGGVHE